MKTFNIKRISLIKRGDVFYLDDSDELVKLSSTDWQHAEEESETYLAYFKEKYPTCMVIID